MILLRHLTYGKRLHNLNDTTLVVRRIESEINKVNWSDQYEKRVPRRGMKGIIR